MSEPTRTIIDTNSVAETEALGIRLACALDGGMLVTLSGELGAGKTVFVRGLACGLNTPPGVVVTSPTYVLLHTYEGGRLMLHHLDLYRMAGGANEFEAAGLYECFNDPNAVVCVEWPERLSNFNWPADRVQVTIEHHEPQRRRIILSATGERARKTLSQLV